MNSVFTVGYYDAKIDDWYFNGEYERYEDAVKCARKTATAKRCQSRVTDHKTGRQEFFNPGRS